MHFGSRGFGHTVASGFLALGQNEPWGTRVPEREVLLDLDSPIGDDYWALMTLAGRYAYAGREWVARKVVAAARRRASSTSCTTITTSRGEEEHGGRPLIVVRKGATPAFPGQRGFIGGSMGDDAVIVRGRRGADARAGGARSAASGALLDGPRRRARDVAHAGGRQAQLADRQAARAGRDLDEMMRDWMREKGVILRGGGTDESPHVYRRLPDVLAAQRGTIEILHTLRPLDRRHGGRGGVRSLQGLTGLRCYGYYRLQARVRAAAHAAGALRRALHGVLRVLSTSTPLPRTLATTRVMSSKGGTPWLKVVTSSRMRSISALAGSAAWVRTNDSSRPSP